MPCVRETQVSEFSYGETSGPVGHVRIDLQSSSGIWLLFCRISYYTISFSFRTLEGEGRDRWIDRGIWSVTGASFFPCGKFTYILLHCIYSGSVIV